MSDLVPIEYWVSWKSIELSDFYLMSTNPNGNQQTGQGAAVESG